MGTAITTLDLKHKGWRKRTLTLSQLEKIVRDARQRVGDEADPPVVAVVQTSTWPREGPVLAGVLRSELLNDHVGDQLNELAGSVTDSIIEEVVEVADLQLSSDGDVLYIAVGVPQLADFGSARVFDYQEPN